MADDTQEKTEQPTSRRLDDAREEGRIAYSKEMTSAVVLMLGLAAVHTTGPALIEACADLTRALFALPVQVLGDLAATIDFSGELLGEVGSMVLPFLIAALAAVLVPGFLQAGIRFSPKALTPNFGKLDPTKGFKKLVSSQGVVALVSNIAKTALVGVLVWVTLTGALPRLQSLSGAGFLDIGRAIFDLLFTLGFRVGGGLLVLGFLDLLYRKWKHTKDLMMSQKEVKDDNKQADGDPRAKARMREAQRALTLQRMKTDVKGADVVIRNPTHFAVALKYETGSDAAPKCVAKGRGKMALGIINMAEKAGVEVVENRPLARELFRSVRLGDAVPERLFRAVAEVLAWVYRKRRKTVERSHGV